MKEKIVKIIQEGRDKGFIGFSRFDTNMTTPERMADDILDELSKFIKNGPEMEEMLRRIYKDGYDTHSHSGRSSRDERDMIDLLEKLKV